MGLPRDVIREDRRLELTASKASEELAHLRWHWTLDETNAKRVSLREYARAVGRDRRAIEKYAHGYVRWTAGDGTVASLTESIERAALSAEREAATEAVAKARGVAFGTARQNRPTEVRRVLTMARERAEETGGSVADEARKAARLIVASETATEQQKADRHRRRGLRYIELEERLGRVRRELVASIEIAAALDIGDEERELLEETLGNVRALLGLLDLAIVGATEVDWDAELTRLGDGR